MSDSLVRTSRHVTEDQRRRNAGKLAVRLQTVLGTEFVETRERERLIIEVFKSRRGRLCIRQSLSLTTPTK
jgi:hypothetical protein